MTSHILIAVLALLLPPPAGQSKQGPPETFSANAQVKGELGAAATILNVHIERYSTDDERERALQAMKTGGDAALRAALSKGAPLGYVEISGKKWAIRYARQHEIPNGRSIVVVTDQPLFFVGGGQVNAKPREGYDLAVVQFQVDSVGLGRGTMAAAARLKAGGPNGLEVADYADEPIKLVTVSRRIS